MGAAPIRRRPTLGKCKRHTEFALTGEGLGVRQGQSHLQTILCEETSDLTFDEVGLGSLEMPFQDGQRTVAQQATLGAGLAGIGCRRSVAVARPANLGAVVPARLDKRHPSRGHQRGTGGTQHHNLHAFDILGDNAAAAFLWTASQEPQKNLYLQKKQPEQSTRCGNNWCGRHHGPSVVSPTLTDVERADPRR